MNLRPGYNERKTTKCLLLKMLFYSTNNGSSTDRCVGVEVRAPASQSVDRGFNSLVESYQKALKMVSTASLLDARHLWEGGEQAGKFACCVFGQGT